MGNLFKCKSQSSLFNTVLLHEPGMRIPKQNNDQREFQAGFVSTVILFIESSLSDHDLLRMNLKQEVSVCHVCLSEHDLF